MVSNTRWLFEAKIVCPYLSAFAGRHTNLLTSLGQKEQPTFHWLSLPGKPHEAGWKTLGPTNVAGL